MVANNAPEIIQSENGFIGSGSALNGRRCNYRIKD